MGRPCRCDYNVECGVLLARSACSTVGRAIRWHSAAGRAALSYLSGRCQRSWDKQCLRRQYLRWEDPLWSLAGNSWWETGDLGRPREVARKLLRIMEPGQDDPPG